MNIIRQYMATKRCYLCFIFGSIFGICALCLFGINNTHQFLGSTVGQGSYYYNVKNSTYTICGNDDNCIFYVVSVSFDYGLNVFTCRSYSKSLQFKCILNDQTCMNHIINIQNGTQLYVSYCYDNPNIYTTNTNNLICNIINNTLGLLTYIFAGLSGLCFVMIILFFITYHRINCHNKTTISAI